MTRAFVKQADINEMGNVLIKVALGKHLNGVLERINGPFPAFLHLELNFRGSGVRQ